MKRLLGLTCLVLAACGDKPAAVDAAPPVAPPPSEMTEAIAPETAAGMAIVTEPVPRARVASPLRVAGDAPGPWFFEAVLPVTLVVNGETVAEAPGEAQGDWMTTDRVPFLSELVFDVAQETAAELVVAQDMPGFDDNGDELPALEIRIPVTLLPPGAP